MESLSTESVIAILTGGVITGLSWWVTRLYSTVDDLQDVRRRFFWFVELEFCVFYIGLRQFRDRSSGMYGQ